jgi:hypothetical protein
MKTTARLAVSYLLVFMFLILPLQGVTAQKSQSGGSYLAPIVAPDTPLSAIYNTNLIPDGGAETDYTPYWQDNEGFTQIILYGADCGGVCSFPTPYDPGPMQRGASFFYMGTTSNHTNGTNMWIKNKISLAAIQTAVNSGKVRYILSGYFGGEINNPNTAQLHMFFETSGGSSKGEDVVGNVTPQDRQNKTGLLYREKIGYIPSGTQQINMVLQSGYFAPASDLRTGYADNLSLVLLPMQEYLPSI